MYKHFILSCVALFAVISSFAQAHITGTLHACRLDTAGVYVVGTTSTGVWTSSNTVVATVGVTSVGSSYATVTAVWPGTTTLTYTMGGSSFTTVTATFTVDPSPALIEGLDTMCTGISSVMTDAITGGVWTSDAPSVGTIDSATGGIYGVSPGSVDFFYTLANGCSAGALVIVDVTDVGIITGPSALCVGASTTLTETVTGGTWASSSTVIATINSVSGAAVGTAAGTVNFVYTVSGRCGVASLSDTVNVSGVIAAVALSGPSSVTAGYGITLTASAGSGIWVSSNTAVATVSSTGVVTGISAGTATISYTIAGCSGPVTGTATITVTPFDGISGYVTFGSSYTGPVRVWLITYDPAALDLEAMDSTTVMISGDTSVYYQFAGLATDSFRVKATVSYDTSYISTGYTPTYHTSSYYWHDADVIYHTSGTANLNEDINMAAGTSTSGPGFIGGNVTTGANRGTSAGAPVPNLLIYAVNTLTGALVQQTYTDASGNYSFTGLAYGTYLIHPELINYTTIDYTGITLAAGSASVSNASFIEHTVSLVISPSNESVKNIQLVPLSVFVYPNPASSEVNLVWNETTNETGNVTLADITGKTVYQATISMEAGNGSIQLSLPSLTDGSYILTVNTGNISYSNKMQLLH